MKFLEKIHIIQSMVDVVSETSWDSEKAHEKEDELFAKALEFIGDCKTLQESKEIAKLALSSKDIDFSRWCA